MVKITNFNISSSKTLEISEIFRGPNFYLFCIEKRKKFTSFETIWIHIDIKTLMPTLLKPIYSFIDSDSGKITVIFHSNLKLIYYHGDDPNDQTTIEYIEESLSGEIATTILNDLGKQFEAIIRVSEYVLQNFENINLDDK